MPKNKKQKNKGLGDLHEKEIALIRAIREKVRFGEIVIETRQGLPHRFKRAYNWEKLVGEE